MKQNKCFWILLSLPKLFNKELRINYVLEIRNGCDVWEQAFRRYCIDPLASSDADRWGYTKDTRQAELKQIVDLG